MDSKQIILKYILVATIGYMQINASYPGTIPETCVQAFKPAKRLGVNHMLSLTQNLCMFLLE